MTKVLKVSDIRLDVLKKLGDPQSVHWTPADLARYFPPKDWQHYSRQCRWLWLKGLAHREPKKDSYEYSLTALGRSYL